MLTFVPNFLQADLAWQETEGEELPGLAAALTPAAIYLLATLRRAFEDTTYPSAAYEATRAYQAVYSYLGCGALRTYLKRCGGALALYAV